MDRRPSETGQDDDLDDIRTNPNILGARPSGFGDRVPTSDRQQVDAAYDSTSVGAAAMATPMASVLVSSPPILSARPKSVRPQPLDQSELSTTGRRSSNSPLETGTVTESTKLSESRLQFVVECEVSLKPCYERCRDNVGLEQSEHNAGAALREP